MRGSHGPLRRHPSSVAAAATIAIGHVGHAAEAQQPRRPAQAGAHRCCRGPQALHCRASRQHAEDLPRCRVDEALPRRRRGAAGSRLRGPAPPAAAAHHPAARAAAACTRTPGPRACAPGASPTEGSSSRPSVGSCRRRHARGMAGVVRPTWAVAAALAVGAVLLSKETSVYVANALSVRRREAPEFNQVPVRFPRKCAGRQD